MKVVSKRLVRSIRMGRVKVVSKRLVRSIRREE